MTGHEKHRPRGLPRPAAGRGASGPEDCARAPWRRRNAARASRLALLLGALPLQTVLAASTTSATDTLDEVVITTGSLIPQTRVEVAKPITVITAEELSARGFQSVADALQQSSFATGSVQGAQYVMGFTPGVQTLSLFGLSPSYVKYLIDGRPMSDYPALYNGQDTVVNISGIPMELVDHIDILPGGQSSIYGSDAIAGVVNVVMKKALDGPVLNARIGGTQDGGGSNKRLALADGFSVGSVDLIAGVQYEKIDPIWGYQRSLTNQYFANGTSPQTAERDYLIYGTFGPTGNGDNAYYFADPNNCMGLASQFGGTLAQQSRPNRGSYCGTMSSGYYTIGNGSENVQGYARATSKISDNIELYADVLVNRDVTQYSVGGNFYGTSIDSSSPTSYYYDPRYNDFLNLQHIFSPEEIGGLDRTLSTNTTNGFRGTVGARGSLTGTWTYDLSSSYTMQRLEEAQHLLLTAPVEAFFQPMFGPSQGPDPYGYGLTTYTPNYAAFYTAVTPAQYASFSGIATSRSRTSDLLVRGQLTNADLFKLPGGPAGIALVAETGNQGWEYTPDPLYLDGGAYGFTAVAGSGHRSRYALTSELRLPVVPMVQISASGRYDKYVLSSDDVSKSTYNLGLEFRPQQSILLRGRIGTAFKAPTLSDEFQGNSGFFETLTDYYQCAKAGFSGATIGQCSLYNQSIQGYTQGNAKLQPITADVSDGGIVWRPLQRLQLSADYLHWAISNEVNQQSADQLLITESQCRLGTLVITSPTCVAAFSQVTRSSSGTLLSVLTPKVNVSNETVNAVIVAGNYRVMAGNAGTFDFDLSWNDMLKHSYQLYSGDTPLDLLADPTQSQEFKSKVTASVTWNKGEFSTTLYGIRYGSTPNYVATISGYGVPGAGTLSAWFLLNASVRYQATPGVLVSLSVENLMDKMPPVDNSYPGTSNQPYNEFNYNVYGRMMHLEATYQVGR